MKKIYIFVKACERRVLDSKKFHQYFTKNDHQIVYSPEEADIIIFVTCAVFNTDVEDALNKIKEFQRHDAELIVAGCLPEINKKELAEVFNGRTISTKDIDKIDELFPEHEIKFNNIEDANIFDADLLFKDVYQGLIFDLIKTGFNKVHCFENVYLKSKYHILNHLIGENSLLYRFLTKPKNPLYYIRISRGCLGNCSYCGIKKAIGTHKSKPLDQCINEFKKGVSEGYKQFVLTADDTGAYGLDIGISFTSLLSGMIKIEGNYSIEPQGINPIWIVKYIDELEEILKKGKIKTILTPIQSGSSRILKLMHRYNDTEKMKEAFLRLKKVYPELKLYTHYIVGFPTETEEDVKQTLTFIKEANFNGGYIFLYSCKTGSEAEKIEPKIPKEEIDKRMTYAKKYFKKTGYKVVYLSRMHFFIFEK